MYTNNLNAKVSMVAQIKYKPSASNFLGDIKEQSTQLLCRKQES